ncbi:MAG: translation elongation factor Ts [Clostridia bacterium]|nr:translation elongation factor Ts [Clostridia bacterium]
MAVTAKDITELRQRTQAGMLDCKNALEATNGDMQKAAEWLREKGMASAAKKEGRIAAEGKVESYVHLGGKIGVLVECNCETDFVAKSEAFTEFVHNIALQIAASKPLYVSEEEADPKQLEAERKIYTAQVQNEGKPANVVERIVEGKIKKYLQEVCLLDQVYFRDGTKTINEYLKETIGKIGEKITIRRFVRYEMGEGLQKKEENFAEEIQKQIDKQKNK